MEGSDLWYPQFNVPMDETGDPCHDEGIHVSGLKVSLGKVSPLQSMMVTTAMK